MGRSWAGSSFVVWDAAPHTASTDLWTLSMQYKHGEAVRLWVNKVGPYDNPQETYNYYYLPFCAPTDAGKPKHKWGGLGEVLQGNELIDSQLDVKFKSELHVPLQTSCHWCIVHTALKL